MCDNEDKGLPLFGAEAHSFLRASVDLEDCSLLRTGNVRGQISGHIFRQIGAIVFTGEERVLLPPRPDTIRENRCLSLTETTIKKPTR